MTAKPILLSILLSLSLYASGFASGRHVILLILDSMPLGDTVWIGDSGPIVVQSRRDSIQLKIVTRQDLMVRHGGQTAFVPQPYLKNLDEIRMMKGFGQNPGDRFVIWGKMNPSQPIVHTQRGQVWLSWMMDSLPGDAQSDSVDVTFTGPFFDDCQRLQYGRTNIPMLGWKYDPSTEISGVAMLPTSKHDRTLRMADADTRLEIPISRRIPFMEVSVGNEKTGISVRIYYLWKMPLFD